MEEFLRPVKVEDVGTGLCSVLELVRAAAAVVVAVVVHAVDAFVAFGAARTGFDFENGVELGPALAPRVVLALHVLAAL